MKTASSRSRLFWLAASFLAFTTVASGARAQQPAINPSPPAQPPIPQSAQPGAGPGSQPMVSPPSSSAQTSATSAPGQASQSGQPTPPPAWQQAMPQNEEAVKLAPVPALPIATAADKLPVTRLKLPKNFNIEIYAAGLTNARSLRVDDKGNVFVTTRVLDRVYAVTDKNGKKEVKTLATGLNSPNGIALHNGTLYIAEINKISKIDNVADQLDNPRFFAIRPAAVPEPSSWALLAAGLASILAYRRRHASARCANGAQAATRRAPHRELPMSP